jgi:hypothetical protein
MFELCFASKTVFSAWNYVISVQGNENQRMFGRTFYTYLLFRPSTLLPAERVSNVFKVRGVTYKPWHPFLPTESNRV